MRHSTRHPDALTADQSPPHSRTPRRWWTIAAVVAVALILGAACFPLNRALRAEALQRDRPSANASAEQVVRTYLAAAKSRDCDLVSALTSATAGPAWCVSDEPLGWLLDEDSSIESYAHLGPPQRYVSGKECFTADITQTGSFVAEPTEPQGYEFCFILTPEGWRLASQDVSGP